ncbi:MAG: DUF4340 domain-containing protein [Methylohalobius sp.]|nr:DUF4340 domain-containing protein [Methylohalobius sp.]
MRRRWLVILSLLFLVAGLGGWVYWLAQAPEKVSPPLLAAFAPDAVQQIVIERQNERLEFTRGQEGWRMVQPFEAPADAYHMEQLLSLPNQSSQTRYPASELDLARLELIPPKATVRLGESEVRFGGQNPLNFQRYVQIGDTVYLIEDTLFYQLTAPATTWIEHKLLPSGHVQSLELPGWRITAKEGGGWTSEPQLPSADIERLMDTWRTARAVQVNSYPQEPPPSAERIRLSVEGKVLEFIVLQREPELVLLRPEQKLSYHFYGSIGQRLLTPTLPSPSDAGASRSRSDTPES